MYIQVGYGLEGALPDALAKRIIENEIKPYFHNGDFDSGLRAGVAAILQATKGEYKGTGRTVADRSHGYRSPPSVGIIGFFVALVIFSMFIRFLRYTTGCTMYSRAGRAISYGIMSATSWNPFAASPNPSWWVIMSCTVIRPALMSSRAVA